MGRIRTIKPEFPQSESMGRVSREARLLFVQLWTVCDDEGRTRAASRMLASILYPYDDDAPKLIDAWMDELEREGCIARYQADGSAYLQVCNWLNHQKIDKPSKSKFPPFAETSRILAKNREESTRDVDLDLDRDQGKDLIPADLHPLNYANRLAEDLGLPATKQNLHVIATAIEALIKTGKSKVAAFEFLLARAKDAQENGILVNSFWFNDGKYNVNTARKQDENKRQEDAIRRAARRVCGETDERDPQSVSAHVGR